MPGVVGMRTHLATLPPFIRQLFWVYYSFIALCLVSFCLMSVAFAGTLAAGGGLARALCVFFALFWTLRRMAGTFVFDLRPYLTSPFGARVIGRSTWSSPISPWSTRWPPSSRAGCLGDNLAVSIPRNSGDPSRAAGSTSCSSSRRSAGGWPSAATTSLWLFVAAAVVAHSGRGPDRRGDRGARQPVRADARRVPERDVRQRRRADHRDRRAARPPRRGRQGVDHRQHHRQPAARLRRVLLRRRPQARHAELQPRRGGQRDGHAGARGRGAGHAGDGRPLRVRLAQCAAGGPRTASASWTSFVLLVVYGAGLVFAFSTNRDPLRAAGASPAQAEPRRRRSRCSRSARC